MIISNIYSIGPIGSRNDILQVWTFTDGSRQYKAGCFSGSEEEFTTAVTAEHKESKHAVDYLAAIQFINVLAGVANE